MNTSKKLIDKLVRETIEQKYTDVKKSWDSMMDDLSKDIKYSIIKDDAGNYNICDCEPYHISIRPIIHDIFDVVSVTDGADQIKKLYLKYEDLKKFVKGCLSSKKLNYVDSTFERNVENSKDKEGGKKADTQSNDENVINPSNNKVVKNIKADPMNKEIDDPTQPMRSVGKFDKLIDYKSKKPDYTPPTLPRKLQRLVLKLKNKKLKSAKK